MLSYTQIVLLALCCVNVQCLPADVSTVPDNGVLKQAEKLPIKPPTDGLPVKPPTSLPAKDPTDLPVKPPSDVPVKVPADVPTKALTAVEPTDAAPVKAPINALPVKEATDALPTKHPQSVSFDKVVNDQPNYKTTTHVKYYVSNPNKATVDTKSSNIPDADAINEEIIDSLKAILPFLHILFNDKNGSQAHDPECIDDMIIQLVPEDPKSTIHPSSPHKAH